MSFYTTPPNHYRIIYDKNNLGIYAALKLAIPISEWNVLKNMPEINWLPIIEPYPLNARAYFFDKGYAIFEKMTLPIIKQYLDEKYINIKVYARPGALKDLVTEKYANIQRFDTDPPGEISYIDMYQILFKN